LPYITTWDDSQSQNRPTNSAEEAEFVNHISDHDLERYYLGMVKDEAGLASLEEHLLACAACVERAESTQDYVDALRAALVTIRED
jgi:anti-sigma factor RsiW